MTRRRRDRTPDTRLNWRDPNMPCLYRMQNGYRDEMVEVDPAEASRMARDNLNSPHCPEWFNDDTYGHIKRKRRR